MLLDLEQVSSFVKAQEDLIKSLKLALISHDPKRLPDMFPAFAPPPDNSKAIQALDSGAPVEIRTDVPAAEAQELEPIPAGDASEEIPAPDAYEQVPAGDATEVIPTGEAMEVPRIPAGKATEIVPEIIDGDLLTQDGVPYGSKTAANVRAKKEGLGPANVVEIPGAGWVVRPQPKTLGPAPISVQPAGTRAAYCVMAYPILNWRNG